MGRDMGLDGEVVECWERTALSIVDDAGPIFRVLGRAGSGVTGRRVDDWPPRLTLVCAGALPSWTMCAAGALARSEVIAELLV